MHAKHVMSSTGLAAALTLCVMCHGSAVAQAVSEIVVATVNNGHMITMQKLTPFFEKQNPDIKVRWVTLDENTLRQRVSASIVHQGEQFDVVTIGMYETPIWAKYGWLAEFKPDSAYDVQDLLPAMRAGLSYQGKLYAAPFYGESSMTMYRHDLLTKVGLVMPNRPTWAEIGHIAAKVHDPAQGVYGICLRGKPGWGDNMALLSTMVNVFGGQWFDTAWRPQLDTPAWKAAIGFYVALMNQYGPPNASANSFNENLALFNAGKCGVWVDATIAASFVSDPKQSKWADQVEFAQAPTAVTNKGANWLWAWSLAIPVSSTKAEHAQRFLRWATSKEYVRLVGSQIGWGQVPTGTRVSTYRSPEFLNVARRWAFSEASAIALVNPRDSTLPRSPYTGVQFAAIPEFGAIASDTGLHISRALAGVTTVDQALLAAQAAAQKEMRRAGYYK